MSVYVLTQEPYHDNGWVIGVYATVDAARAARPSAIWGQPRVLDLDGLVDTGKEPGSVDDLIIAEHEVQG